MPSIGDQIANPRTGQRMVFRTITPELLEIETRNPPHVPPESKHVHPCQESGAQVLAGSLRFSVRGTERDVGPGESIAIPAGAPHYFWNPGDQDAHAIQFMRPPLKTIAFFETYFALARDGKLDENGMPSLLQLALAPRPAAAHPEQRSRQPHARSDLPGSTARASRGPSRRGREVRFEAAREARR